MKFFARKAPSDLIQGYLKATKKLPARKTPIHNCKLVAIDCETTGFKVGVDVVLSVAALPIEGASLPLAKLRNWLVCQPNHRPNQATTIHGILPQESANGVTEAALIEDILPLLSGAIIVGHHAAFDAAMINELLKRHHHTKLSNSFIDTAELAMVELDAFKQTGYAHQRPPSLDEVSAQLNVPAIGRHTAAGDAFTTAEIFLILSGRRKSRYRRDLLVSDFPLKKL